MSTTHFASHTNPIINVQRTLAIEHFSLICLFDKRFWSIGASNRKTSNHRRRLLFFFKFISIDFKCSHLLSFKRNFIFRIIRFGQLSITHKITQFSLTNYVISPSFRSIFLFWFLRLNEQYRLMLILFVSFLFTAHTDWSQRQGHGSEISWRTIKSCHRKSWSNTENMGFTKSSVCRNKVCRLEL